MKLRPLAVAATALISVALPAAAASAHPAARHKTPPAAKVTATPSTTAPAAGFDVPVTGTVTGGPATRQVVLLVKSGKNWRGTTIAKTRNHHYTFWVHATRQTVTYRVLAAVTKTSGAGASAPFTLRPTIAPKGVSSVTGASCKKAGSNYQVHFTAHLVTGERVTPTMTLYGAPYLDVLTTQYGGHYNVEYEFKGC